MIRLLLILCIGITGWVTWNYIQKDSQPDEPSTTQESAATSQSAQPPAPEKIVQKASLSPDATRALEFYKRWIVAREAVAEATTSSGQLKMTMTEDEARKNFAENYGGAMPTTPEGIKKFKESFGVAYTAGMQLVQTSEELVAEVSREPAGVRNIFWSLLPTPGVSSPVLAGDGRSVYFVMKARDEMESLFLRDAYRLDPKDRDPADDIYRWDLSSGEIQVVTPSDPLDALYSYDFPMTSSDGKTFACYAKSGDITKRHHNILITDLTAKSSSLLLSDVPFPVKNLPAPIPVQDRRIMPPSLSADGQVVSFIGGTYLDRTREDGYADIKMSVLIHDRRANATYTFTKPAEKLDANMVSPSGGAFAVIATPNALLTPPVNNVPPPAGKEPGFYLIQTRGGATHSIPLPQGAEWQRNYNDPSRISLSADGSKIAFAIKVGAYKQVYCYDTKTELTKLISANSQGAPANAESDFPQISSDGRWIAFVSQAGDLDGAPSPNRLRQVFLHEKDRKTILISKDAEGKPLKRHCQGAPSISQDGSVVAFVSAEAHLPGSIKADVLANTKIYPGPRLYCWLREQDRFITLGQQRE